MSGAANPSAEPEAVDPLADSAAAAPEPAAVAPEATEPSRRRKELPPDEIVVSSTAQPGTEDRPKRGWWQRGFFGS
jgi:ribonuclease E